MRKYTPKDNVQKKSYYTDRFYVAPTLPKSDVETDEIFSADLKALESNFEIKESYIQLNHMIVYINPKENKKVLEFMKNELNYDFLVEMSAIDWLADKKQFEIFYQLLSTSKRKRIRVKCFIQENEAIESVESIYRSADWSEREMFDMFGIKLNNHPYPKRILMPDDWYDYPLRKTYPLQGDETAQWYEVDKIFGKENRDIIGPENRDPAMVDRYDTERFSRLGYEVPFGFDIKEHGETKVDVESTYQEEGGVPLISKYNNNVEQLDKRK